MKTQVPHKQRSALTPPRFQTMHKKSVIKMRTLRQLAIRTVREKLFQDYHICKELEILNMTMTIRQIIEIEHRTMTLGIQILKLPENFKKELQDSATTLLLWSLDYGCIIRCKNCYDPNRDEIAPKPGSHPFILGYIRPPPEFDFPTTTIARETTNEEQL